MTEVKGKYDSKNVSKILENAIEEIIENKSYDFSSVNDWITQIIENSMAKLKQTCPGFKHIVTCVIMNKNGSGLHSSSSVYWDNSTDDCCTTRWENKYMNVIVSNYALAI